MSEPNAEWEGLSELTEEERRHRKREGKEKRRKSYSTGKILLALGFLLFLGGGIVALWNGIVGFTLVAIGFVLFIVSWMYLADGGVLRLRHLGTVRQGGSRIHVVEPVLGAPDESEDLREARAKEAEGYFSSLEEEPREPTVKVRCLKCQGLNEEEAHYCSHCGASLRQTETGP